MTFDEVREKINTIVTDIDSLIPLEVKSNIKSAETKTALIVKAVLSIKAKIDALEKIIDNYNKKGLASLTNDVVKSVREGVINKDEAMAKLQEIMGSINPTTKTSEAEEIDKDKTDTDEKEKEKEVQPEQAKQEKPKKSKKKLKEVKPEGSAD